MHGYNTTILEDNQPAIKIAKNPITSARTKHVALRHHFVRDHVECGNIDVVHLDTEHMIADLLTKAMGNQATSRHRSFLFGSCEGCALPGGV